MPAQSAPAINKFENKSKEENKMETESAVVEALKAMAESQKAIAESLKKVNAEVEDLKRAAPLAQLAPEKKDATKGIVTSSRIDYEKGLENEEGLVIETTGSGKSAMWKKPGRRGELPK